MDRLIKMPELEDVTSLHRSSIYQKINEGEFPPQVKLGGRGVAWRESDIQRWMDGLVISGVACNE